MINRCTNPNHPRFPDYGGRNITVCKRWLEFKFFADDMLPTWDFKLTIERINNNGNYELSNCKWVTRTQQARNKRSSKLDVDKAQQIRELYNTNKYTQKQIGRIFNVSHTLISEIVNNIHWRPLDV